jgi:hypothetical protein
MTDSDHDRESVAVLKRDRRGRVLTTPSQRLALLQEFEKSGLSGPAFAQVVGIKYQTFATWRQQQKSQSCSTIMDHRELPVSGDFVQAVVQPSVCATAQTALQVRLPGGACVELMHRHQVPLVVELLTALQRPC